MHSARIENSDRLRRVLNVLCRGPHTTLEIMREAQVCAVNSIVAELRANGIPVRCECKGRGRFLYSLSEGQLNLNLRGGEA